MDRNTSISLGSHFTRFIQARISEGRFKNASEVIRAGLRLLEEEETRMRVLKEAIREGDQSGIVSQFDSEQLLKDFKEKLGQHG